MGQRIEGKSLRNLCVIHSVMGWVERGVIMRDW